MTSNRLLLLILVTIFDRGYPRLQLCDTSVCNFPPCNGNGCNNNEFICTNTVSTCSLQCNANCDSITLTSSAQYTEIICGDSFSCNDIHISIPQANCVLYLECTQPSSCTNINIHSHPLSTVQCEDYDQYQCINNVHIDLISTQPPSTIPFISTETIQTTQPTLTPTMKPTSNPTSASTTKVTSNPTQIPTNQVTSNPTINPTNNPTLYATSLDVNIVVLTTKKPTFKPTQSSLDEAVVITPNIMVSAEQILTRNTSTNSKFPMALMLLLDVLVIILIVLCCAGIYIKVSRNKHVADFDKEGVHTKGVKHEDNTIDIQSDVEYVDVNNEGICCDEETNSYGRYTFDPMEVTMMELALPKSPISHLLQTPNSHDNVFAESFSCTELGMSFYEQVKADKTPGGDFIE